MEHVAGGQDGLAIAVNLPLRSLQVAVAANDFPRLRIPDDELFVAILTGIELVLIHSGAHRRGRVG